MAKAARFFDHAHNRALDDRRVTLFETDGRTFLAATKKRYDVIVSGVSELWVTGVSNLLSVDYFRQLARRLSERGVAAIW